MKLVCVLLLAAAIALGQTESNSLFASIRKYDQLSKADPKNPEFHYELARLYRRLAAACATRLRESNRESARLAQLEGEAWAMQGSFDQALKAYGRALERAPSLAGSHLGIAMIHIQKRDFDSARVSFKRELEVSPDNAAASALLQQLDRAR